MKLVEVRALELGCVPVGVLGNVVLCYRKADGTYITWRVCIQRITGTDTYQADFSGGDYDMSWDAAKKNLIYRAGY